MTPTIEEVKRVAARDLMIKELQDQLVDTRATLLGLQPDFGGPIAAQMGKAVLRINEALAKSEHHNFRALEKMLLEARIEVLEQARLGNIETNGLHLSLLLAHTKAKLAELNKE